MLEYKTEAVVLDKEEMGEYDSRVFFYTKELGKVSAKATSARKITSKLSAHLEPLNLIKLRLVHKNNFMITDALVIDNFTNWRQSANLGQVLEMLNFVKEMTFEGQDDYQLWTTLKSVLYSSTISYISLLKVFGFDPQFALCESCQNKPNYFFAKDFIFYCKNCLDNNLCSNSFIQLS